MATRVPQDIEQCFGCGEQVAIYSSKQLVDGEPFCPEGHRCSRCGAFRPGRKCEHEWIVAPAGMEVCSKCLAYRDEIEERNPIGPEAYYEGEFTDPVTGEKVRYVVVDQLTYSSPPVFEGMDEKLLGSKRDLHNWRSFKAFMIIERLPREVQVVLGKEELIPIGSVWKAPGRKMFAGWYWDGGNLRDGRETICYGKRLGNVVKELYVFQKEE
jgi:hypothetical protein